MEIQRAASVKAFILFRKPIETEGSRYNMTEEPTPMPFGKFGCGTLAFPSG
jgi:hypothetical protein